MRVAKNLFQADGPSNANARFQKSVFDGGVTRFPMAAERSVRRGWCEATGVEGKKGIMVLDCQVPCIPLNTACIPHAAAQEANLYPEDVV